MSGAPPDDRLYLHHILDAIVRIESYLNGVDAPQFQSTPLLQDGVIRQLEIIGEAAKRLTAALRASGLRCEGVNLFLADGEAAMQEIFHVHLHVFPRFAGDGFGLRFGPHYRERPEREALEAAAERIRAALAE